LVAVVLEAQMLARHLEVIAFFQPSLPTVVVVAVMVLLELEAQREEMADLVVVDVAILQEM